MVNIAFTQRKIVIVTDSTKHVVIVKETDPQIDLSSKNNTCECSQSNMIDQTVKCCPVREDKKQEEQFYNCCCVVEGITESCTPTIQTMMENKKGSCNCCRMSNKNNLQNKTNKSGL